MSNVSQKLNLNLNLFTPKKMIETLLYGNKRYKRDVNTYILNQTIGYINKSKRFEKKPDDDHAETLLSHFFLLDGGWALGKWPSGGQILLNGSQCGIVYVIGMFMFMK